MGTCTYTRVTECASSHLGVQVHSYHCAHIGPCLLPCLRQAFLSFTAVDTGLTGPSAPRDPPASVSLSCCRITEIIDICFPAQPCTGSEPPNSGSHAFMASTAPTEPSPQPRKCNSNTLECLGPLLHNKGFSSPKVQWC